MKGYRVYSVILAIFYKFDIKKINEMFKTFLWVTARLLSKKNRAVPSPISHDGTVGQHVVSSR